MARGRRNLLRGMLALLLTALGLLILPVAATAASDLRIEKTDAADPVTNTDDVTYTITVTNDGPDAATGFTVGDPVPRGATFKSSPDGCFLVPEYGTVVCPGGALASGASQSFEVVFTANVSANPYDINNTATVYPQDVDGNLTNNSATESTHIRRLFDLVVERTSVPERVTLNRPFNYSIGVLNLGPDAAQGVELKFTLPDGVEFIFAEGCTFAGGVVTCLVPTLPDPNSAHFNVRVRPTRLGVLEATLNISAPTLTADQEERKFEKHTRTLTTRVVSRATPERTPLCHGNTASIVGRPGGVDQTIRGTRGRDVIVARGGDDRVIGRGGDDVICLGGGDDVGRAGGGDDRVYGAAGSDELDGARGRDVCIGGPAKDAKRRCELSRDF